MSCQNKCFPAISSHSLGRAYAGHDLPTKFSLAAAAGFMGIEMFFEDIDHFARATFSCTSAPSDAELIGAAAGIRALCESLELTITCLQPFTNFEGTRDHAAHAALVERMRLWVQIARKLGTDLIAIPSTYLPTSEATGDVARIVADLREVAQLGVSATAPTIRFSYEALSFGTYIDTWEASWEIVKAVDRSNFGLCLDTFNIAARAWADPAKPTGRRDDAYTNMAASLQRLATQVDPARVFQLQVVDGQRLQSPLDATHPLHHPDQVPRMSWSRSCRLFYGESGLGAYLPVRDICAIIFNQLRWRGWVSMELFNASMAETGSDVPQSHAQRGWESWRALVKDFPQLVETGAPTYEVMADTAGRPTANL